MSSVILLFDYLLSTKIGNAIGAVIGALILYGLFKLVVRIIDYIILRRIMKLVMMAVYGEYYEEDEEDGDYNTAPASNQEDEQSQKKDKKREQKREAERMQNLENEIIGGKTRSKPKQKIVGVVKPVGKWTERVMKQWLQKHKDIDMNLVNELGYFQAMVIAERKAQGIGTEMGGKNGGRGI